MSRRPLLLLATFSLCSLCALDAAAYDMFQMTEAGRGNVGITSSINFTRAQNQLEGGDVATNSTLFLLATPKFGYFIANHLEFNLQAGLLLRRLQRDAETRATESSALVNAGANFHMPMNKELSLIPGFGIGGYFGRSSRPLVVSDENMNLKTIEEATKARGLDLYAQLMIGYRATENVQLQAGLNAHYLYGVEFSENIDSLRSNTINASIAAGLLYFF